MSLDPITEAIAHFAGFFELAAEEARGRLDYDEFRALKAKQMDGAEIIAVGTAVQAPYDLKDVEPGLRYIPFDDTVLRLWTHSRTDGHYHPPGAAHTDASHPQGTPHFGGLLFSLPAHHEYILAPPGSTAVVVQQVNHLYDNDVLNMTDAQVDFAPTARFDARLDALAGQADALDPVGELVKPDSEAAIAGLVSDVARIVGGDHGDGPSGARIPVATGAGVDGIHVDGAIADDAPKLSDYMPQPEEESAPDPVAFAAGVGEIEPAGSVTLDAGANLLVNEAFMANSWIVSPVIAVMGDAVSVNLISQINVWSDSDFIGPDFAGWADPQAAPTQAFNIASVTVEPMADPAAGDADTPSAFPEQWAVTRLDGNLVLLDWIEQLNFVTDHDATVLTQTGTQTLLQTGDNTSYNSFSLVEPGASYDLVVVGGGYYHANVIHQTNVLLDDDQMWAANDIGAPGQGTVSTGDNLLWNEASIHTVGEMRFENMPENYLQAAQGLAGGSDHMPAGLSGHPAHAGLGTMKVLYVSGSILDMQNISQTNILGDSDQVAMYRESLEQDMAGEWSVSTGSNHLLNIATIVDAGVDGTVYAGGEIYSDALLYQAELISDDPFQATGDPSELASEAVVFLADDMLEPESHHNNGHAGEHVPDAAHVDVMQTMLA